MASPYHPPGYTPRPLHAALIATHLLGRIHPLLLAPVWIGLAAAAGRAWENYRLAAAGTFLVFLLADGVLLALLPLCKRSFGPVTPPLVGLALVRLLLTISVGLIWPTAAGMLSSIALQGVVLIVTWYATWIEPFRIGVTHAQLRSPKLVGHPPLHLLHITDLHVEYITPREERLLDLAETLSPDVIVLTGDYLNLSTVHDPRSQAEARHLLASLCQTTKGPVYAITGSPPVDLPEVVPAIFEGLPITWLSDEAIETQINGQQLTIIGVRCTRERTLDAPRLQRLLAAVPADRFTLLLYHSPDLMPEAAEAGVDLYLCGHTHGGQLRLPLLGALITSSDFGKRYEMGRYVEDQTVLYVSRGLGMEGMGAPRARLLSPPEIVQWTLSSQASP